MVAKGQGNDTINILFSYERGSTMSENEKQKLDEELKGKSSEIQKEETKEEVVPATTEAKEKESTEKEIKEEIVQVSSEIQQEATSNDFQLDKENLKSETSATINEVRETIKNVNFKEDTEATKGFLMKFLKNPISEMKMVASSGDSFFKMAVILAAVWTVAVFLRQFSLMVRYGSLGSIFRASLVDSVLGIAKSTVAPAVSLVVMAGIILLLDKSKKHSLMGVLTTVTVAKMPLILAEVVSLLTVIGSEASRLTSPFMGFCRVISIVLMFFGLKELHQESDDNTFMKKFIIIQLAFYGVGIITGFLGINLV